MSNYLAIGAVTAVLRNLLETAAQDHELQTLLGNVLISALPPDRIQIGQGSPNRINLFLFQANESAALRNADYPSRNGRGDRIANPKLALDLHYLVTAYGSADFHSEALLGLAMFVFHETPVLPRQLVRDILGSLPAGDLFDGLRGSRLADQIEQIKIAPRILNVEEISKIWTAVQSQYRLTATYHVSVVLIEADQPAITPLPVLTRGEPIPNIGDQGVFVHTGLLPPVATLTALKIPDDAPALRMGQTLTLTGHHLSGANVRAHFKLVHTTKELELAADPGGGDGKFTVTLPGSSPAWQAGIYEVTARMEQNGKAKETNRLSVVLAPRIDSIVANGNPVASISITFSPPVQPSQTVVLLVGTRELLPNAFAAPTSTLAFDAPAAPNQLASGQQWIRLRVDGVESLLVDFNAKPPAFLASQGVVLP
jgi:hypothetical protein